MKALTLTQPWASLVAIGAKKIETRSWATSYRGPLAIHAGAGLGPVGGSVGLWRQCAEQPFFRTLEPHFHVTHLNMGGPLGLTDCIDVTELPRGAIVAVATLMDCQRMDPSATAYALHNGHQVKAWWLTDQERAFGDYSPGRYAWLLADVRCLPQPIPCRGALGLWAVPPDVEAQIAEVLR